ncbi:MAG: ATP-dependent Clp protease ATP-binding subunit [Myxococcota bacterium]|jgi:ATP-dependent Clp protease ATP-binding subunit ClpC|nr:ATP-dependent Clp protease ATP-binding subunit [Myxococcota bacterium]
MKEILARAARLAGNGRKKTDTGHLLLALSSGKDLASSLLRERGAATAKIKECLGRLPAEEKGSVDAVLSRARQLGAQCPSPRLSSLLLLASMAVRDGGRAAAALEALGVDVPELQTQALRRITGLDRSGTLVSVSAEREQPVPAPLCPPSPPHPNVAAPILAKDAATHTLASSGRPSGASSPIPAGRLLDMGRSLESAQRRTRAMRTPAGAAIASAPALAQRAHPPKTNTRPTLAELELDPKKAPLLSRAGRNLTKLAAEGGLKGLVARPEEIERIVDVLNKQRHNCPCLVGPEGVGKTSLIAGLAHALAQGDHAPRAGNILVELGPSELLQACGARGNAFELTAALQKECSASNRRVVIVLDDLHLFYGSPEIAEVFAQLRSAIGRGELSCVLATSEREYRRLVEPDAAFSRGLVPIEVSEPSEEVSLAIVESATVSFEAHHGIAFDQKALHCAVRLSSRYVAGGAMPEKALSCLDLAGGRARRLGRAEVSAMDIAQVLSSRLGVSAERLAASDAERLLRLEELLGERIIGHEQVLAAIGETLRRNAAGFGGKRPIGSFLLLGPTGVGKTETAKALAEVLFPGPGAFIRLDMSEFAEAHSAARLVGSPPGYVGHEDGGQLTEAVRKRPFSLVLLDEIEKAHRDVLQLLLQVLDDGRLTDGKGRTVRFDNTVIMMTSNLGHHASASRRSVGFDSRGGRSERSLAAQAVLEAARAMLPLELWNRIDEPLAFESLTEPDVVRIAALLVRHIALQLEAEHGIHLRVEGSALQALIASGGFDAALGARPMRRAVQRLVEAPLSRLVLSGKAVRGDSVVLAGDGQEVILDCSG